MASKCEPALPVNEGVKLFAAYACDLRGKAAAGLR